MNHELTAAPRLESWPWHLLGFILPAVVVYGNLVGGYSVVVGVIVALGIFPIIDIFSKQAAPERVAEVNKFAWNTILAGHSIAQILVVSTLLWRALQDGGQWTTWAAAASTAMSSGASGIISAHENGHRKKGSPLWWLARLNLLSVLYLHFTTEHNHGHHRNYATSVDPVSAPKGRGLWVHLGIAIPRQFPSAWRTHSQRGRRGLRNPVFHGLLLQTALVVGIWYWLGQWVMLAFLMQAGIAIILLEYVNYIQHYGLRCEVGERQTTMHSWESLSLWSRWTLMELPLHPAHHQKSSDPIWALRSHPESPHMPVGYYGLFWPCTIPPLWRRLMDHRIP